MQNQYNKFEYKDLAKNGKPIIPVSDAVLDPEVLIKEKIINEAIEEHFNEKIDFFGNGDIKPEIVDINPVKDNQIDIEKIKSDSYKEGYEAAEKIFAPQLEKSREEITFADLLKAKIESISPLLDIEASIFNFVSDIALIMAKKLHLSIPPDFDSIILNEMVPILNQYYKSGDIIIYVNSEKVDYCNNWFKMDQLPKNIGEKIKIISDDKIAKNDCKIEWQDAIIKYEQSELIAEIEKILESLAIYKR